MAVLRSAVLSIATVGSLCLSLLVACQRSIVAPGPVTDASASAPPLRGFDYEVAIDPALSRADVQLCLRGTPAGRLMAGAPEEIGRAHV